MKQEITAIVTGLGIAMSAATAADLSSYSSRAALLAQPQAVSVAVLPAGAIEAAHVTAPVDVSRYSSRAALIGHGREITVAVLPSVAPTPGKSAELAAARYNSRDSLLGR